MSGGLKALLNPSADLYWTAKQR